MSEEYDGYEAVTNEEGRKLCKQKNDQKGGLGARTSWFWGKVNSLTRSARDYSHMGGLLEDMEGQSMETKMALVLKAREMQKFDVCGTGVLESAEDSLREQIETELEKAIDALDNKNMAGTLLRMIHMLRYAERMGWTDLEGYEAAIEKCDELGIDTDDSLDIYKVELDDPAVRATFQRMFDSCVHNGFEQKLGVPLGRLVVQSVTHVLHEQTKAEYMVQRAKLVAELDEDEDYEPVRVPSQQTSLAHICGKMDENGNPREPVEAKYNEFYLFHGTSPKVADLITDTDFLIKSAPDNGWTFGRGVYAAEYVSHAQFFAGMGEQFHNTECTILVCRAFAGRCQRAQNWAATATPCDEVHELEQNIHDGTYMSTTGSEWPQMNFEVHDFIIPDDDQILPEFIVHCTIQH